jgi:hypothetical protein
MSCDAEYGDEEDECAADSECVWIEDWDSCQETCDDRDEDDCHDPCEWSGDSCSMSCEYKYGDEDDCAADSGCVWVEDWDDCKETCDDRDEDSCDDHCAWSGDSCSMSCEAEYGDDEDECVAVWKSNLQPDFNVRVIERFGPASSNAFRELDESDRFVQKAAKSTSIWPS